MGVKGHTRGSNMYKVQSPVGPDDQCLVSAVGLKNKISATNSDPTKKKTEKLKIGGQGTSCSAIALVTKTLLKKLFQDFGCLNGSVCACVCINNMNS